MSDPERLESGPGWRVLVPELDLAGLAHFLEAGRRYRKDPDTAAQAKHPEPAFDVARRGQGQRLLGIRGRDRCARHGLPALVPDRSGDPSHEGLSRDGACSRQEHEGEE